MPDTPSTKHGIARVADTDFINSGPATIRSAVDSIDSLMAIAITTSPRPAAGKLGRIHRDTTTGVISYDTGSSWVEIVTAASIAGFLSAAAGTTEIAAGDPLPSSPYNGQIIDYIASSTVTWRFRYRAAAAGSYKWEFIGGPPLLHVNTDRNVCGLASWVDLGGTVGPNITVPLAGTYDVYGQASTEIVGGTPPFADTLAWLGLKNGSTNPPDPMSVQSTLWATVIGPTVGYVGTTPLRPRVDVAAANTLLKMVYRIGVNGSVVAYHNRSIAVTPVRVG